ncbi:unnamed protein product [Chrysoparadoxa australica]
MPQGNASQREPQDVQRPGALGQKGAVCLEHSLFVSRLCHWQQLPSFHSAIGRAAAAAALTFLLPLTSLPRKVYRCFNQCSRGFKSKHLDDKEGTCVSNCAEKFIKVTQRVGFRFSEHQAANAAAQQAQAGR